MKMMLPFCVQQQPAFSPITFSHKVAHPKERISEKPFDQHTYFKDPLKVAVVRFFRVSYTVTFFFLTEIHEVHDEAIKQPELYLFNFDIPSLLVYSQVSPRVYLCRVPFMLSALCV